MPRQNSMRNRAVKRIEALKAKIAKIRGSVDEKCAPYEREIEINEAYIKEIDAINPQLPLKPKDGEEGGDGNGGGEGEDQEGEGDGQGDLLNKDEDEEKKSLKKKPKTKPKPKKKTKPKKPVKRL